MKITIEGGYVWINNRAGFLLVLPLILIGTMITLPLINNVLLWICCTTAFTLKYVQGNKNAI